MPRSSGIAGGEISEQAIEKARKQARALFAYDSESVSSQGFWLGFAETAGRQTMLGLTITSTG